MINGLQNTRLIKPIKFFIIGVLIMLMYIFIGHYYNKKRFSNLIILDYSNEFSGIVERTSITSHGNGVYMYLEKNEKIYYASALNKLESNKNKWLCYFLLKGDSVLKNKGSDTVFVFRGDVKSLYKINYDIHDPY